MAIERERHWTERDTPYMTHVHCSPPGTDPGHRGGFLVEGFLVEGFLVEGFLVRSFNRGSQVGRGPGAYCSADGATSGGGLEPTARKMEPGRAEFWALLRGLLHF